MEHFIKFRDHISKSLDYNGIFLQSVSITDEFLFILAQYGGNAQKEPLKIQQDQHEQKLLKIIEAKMHKLNTLILRDNIIGNKGCKAITKCNWKQLSTLNLSNNQIGDEGIHHLSKGNWKKLDHLSLGSNQLTDTSFKHISKTNWTLLKHLFINQNKSINNHIRNLYLLIFSTRELQWLTIKNQCDYFTIKMGDFWLPLGHKYACIAFFR